jgi:glycosyltransferase involved in cell wall biosynthesis
LEKLLIVIPVRNEEKHIQRCLESVINFDVPSDIMVDIAIIDGMSTDNTLQLIMTIIDFHTNIRVIFNPKIFQGPGLNKVIKATKCDWVMRLDAHSYYPKEYLKLCHETALRTDSDNCGGIVNTEAGDRTYSAKLVQALTSHKFGVGNSGFRTGMIQGPADTVPFGYFKRRTFDDIGYFDERLIRAQDYEYNRRILQNGGKIWFNPKIQITYFNQASFSAFLLKQILKEAPYNAYMWYLAPYTFAYRHAITSVFASGIIVGFILSLVSPITHYIFWAVIGIYFGLAIISGFQQAKRYKLLLHVILLPPSFFLFHFAHGLGVLGGIFKLILNVAPVQKSQFREKQL